MSRTFTHGEDPTFLRDAFASLAVRLDAIRGGNPRFTVRFPLGLDHPVGALTRALDDLSAALNASKERRARAERGLEARLCRLEEQSLTLVDEPLETRAPPEGTLAVPVVCALDAWRKDALVAALRAAGVRLTILRRFRASPAHWRAVLESSSTEPRPTRGAPCRNRHPNEIETEYR